MITIPFASPRALKVLFDEVRVLNEALFEALSRRPSRREEQAAIDAVNDFTRAVMRGETRVRIRRP